MPTNLKRRELLQAGGVAALAAAAGCWTHDDSDSSPALLAPGGSGPETLLDGRILFAADYASAVDAVTKTPAAAFTGTGWYVIESSREGYRMSNLQLEFGVEDYAHAEELLDTTPALMFTTDGDAFKFE